MHRLWHFPLCPSSRSIRVALVELHIAFETVEERPWEWRQAFLELNPAGELPVLAVEGGPVLCGVYAISEFLGETVPGDADEVFVPSLFPGNSTERAEVRRLVDWFHGKFNREVGHKLLEERVYAYLDRGSRVTPSADVLRPLRSNLRYHLSYVDYLANRRSWLAGEEMSFADLAAAAHFSSLDYLGEVPWESYPIAKSWYARMKSRPSFRSILADRVPGPPPPNSYADLDF